MILTYLPVGDQQFLDGLTLANSGVKDGLHVQLLQVLMLLIPPAPKGWGVYRVFKCTTGVSVGAGSTYLCDPALRPEGRRKPYTSVSKSFASHLEVPPHWAPPSPMSVPRSSTKGPGDPTCCPCLTLRIPTPVAGSCAGPAPAHQPPQAAAAPGRPCRGPGFVWLWAAVGMGKLTDSSGLTKVWDRTVAKPLGRVGPRRHGNQ